MKRQIFFLEISKVSVHEHKTLELATTRMLRALENHLPFLPTHSTTHGGSFNSVRNTPFLAFRTIIFPIHQKCIHLQKSILQNRCNQDRSTIELLLLLLIKMNSSAWRVKPEVTMQKSSVSTALASCFNISLFSDLRRKMKICLVGNSYFLRKVPSQLAGASLLTGLEEKSPPIHELHGKQKLGTDNHGTAGLATFCKRRI